MTSERPSTPPPEPPADSLRGPPRDPSAEPAPAMLPPAASPRTVLRFDADRFADDPWHEKILRARLAREAALRLRSGKRVSLPTGLPFRDRG